MIQPEVFGVLSRELLDLPYKPVHGFHHRKIGILNTFKNLIKREYQSGLVISVCYPDDPNWSFEKVHDYCYERGFTIYPGKISTTNTFRLCALGAINVNDIKDFFVVLKEALQHYNIIV